MRQRKITDILNLLTSEDCDYWDVRRERWEGSSLEIKNGHQEEVISGEEEGVIIRVLQGNGWGFASTSQLREGSQAAKRAISLAKANDRQKTSQVKLAPAAVQQTKEDIEPEENFLDVGFDQKLQLLADLEARLTQDFVKSTYIAYNESNVHKQVVTSQGTEVETTRPRLAINLSVSGKGDNGDLERVSERVGSVGGYELTKKAYPKIKKLLKRLEGVLTADSAPAGKLPLIMDPDLAGVFAHEAFGHAAEGDLVVSGNSCLKHKLGEKVASDKVTIRDDPTRSGYGHFLYDDEGTPARMRTLVKRGTLNDFILDRESAGKLGSDFKSNGGARAESFRDNPLVRMSNTLIEGGDRDWEELLEEVSGKGIYAKASRGGQVDPAQGTFQFNTQEAYLIADGEIKRPLRGVSFSGFTLDTLKKVAGLTEEVDYSGAGICGKGGQRVTVGTGGPHLLVTEVNVGGSHRE